MSQKYAKLKTLLQELFQLDQPDLDFALYRVMHAKSGESAVAGASIVTSIERVE
jgi:hypothetical protein